jgi:hypothetical protein
MSVTGNSAQEAPARGELELRGPDGRTLGLYNLWALRAMIQAGSVDARCKVRPPRLSGAWPAPQDPGTGEWLPMAELPALREVMDLVGMDPVAAEGERRIAGWQADRAVGDGDDGPSDAYEVSQAIRAVAPPAPGRISLPLIAGLVVGLIALAMLMGLILSC